MADRRHSALHVIARSATALLLASTLALMGSSGAAAREPNGPPASLPPGTGGCDGQSIPVVHDGSGAAPYVRLRAGGVTGAFLLDWGATSSSVDRRRYPDRDGPLSVQDFTLPSFSSGSFERRSYGLAVEPPGGQLGIVGTDFLSLLSAHLTYARGGTRIVLSPTPCRADGLRSRGLVPIRQTGYFSSDLSRLERGRPNVPVIFVGLGSVNAAAQIDTGYEDSELKHSIDINAAMHRALEAAGVRLEARGEVTIGTCAGSERRPVLAPPGGRVALLDERGNRIRSIDGVHLILKPVGDCGGIAGMTEPAAQLGVSILRTLGEIVLDGKGETVWVPAASRD